MPGQKKLWVKLNLSCCVSQSFYTFSYVCFYLIFQRIPQNLNLYFYFSFLFLLLNWLCFKYLGRIASALVFLWIDWFRKIELLFCLLIFFGIRQSIYAFDPYPWHANVANFELFGRFFLFSRSICRAECRLWIIVPFCLVPLISFHIQHF